MKTIPLPLLLALALSAHAQLTIPGADGSDGVFAPTENTVVDLSLATTAAWNTPGNSNGVYDATQWAVVFKYTSVNIPSGVTVTFKNHPSRAPVVWLVSGDVNIAGTINLQDRKNAGTHYESGPGGYRGYYWGYGSVPGSHGLGPSGWDGPRRANYGGLEGADNRPRYGNERIIPLLGGSGGGLAGGGAILIAASRTVSINGTVSAYDGASRTVSGSSGGFRLVANRCQGNGEIVFVGTQGAGHGRIRIEVNEYLGPIRVYPDPSLQLGVTTVQLWPEASDPSCRVVSVDGAAVPADPRASMDLPGADLNTANQGDMSIVIETRNLPVDSTVILRVVPRHSPSFEVNAVHASGNQTLSQWQAMATLPDGFNALIVRAVSP